MKIKKVIALTLWLILLKLLNLQTNQATKISKTSAEIIFEPIGKIIPELSWANIRITLNITTMFTETNDLCKAATFLRQEIKNVLPKEKDSFNYGMMIDMTNNLKQNCLENTYIVDEVAEVFALKNYKRPQHLPRKVVNHRYRLNKSLPKEEETGAVRKVRQIIIGMGIAAVGIITSLTSIFSSKELVKMANQDNSELIDNNNHIIESIQEHETRISRQEQLTKEMKKHLEGLEK